MFERITKTIKASKVRQQFSQVLNQVFHKRVRVIIEKNGIPVAAIVSATDLKRLKNIEAEENKAVDEMRAAFSDFTEEQIIEDVAKVVEEVRAKRRRDFSVLDEIREAFKDVPPEEIEQEVAKAIAEVREENR